MDDKHAPDLTGTDSQTHLLENWHLLNPVQQQRLSQQIKDLDLPTLKRQQQLLKKPSQIPHGIIPFTDYSTAGNAADKKNGQNLIAQGLAGCLIVAGGQGTRLRFNGPKGMCPVTKVKHKSLFQLFAEKTLAAGKQAQRPLPLAIMTSPDNHDETIAFFKENRLFGLDPQQLSFFQQGCLPLLDEQGNLFLESPDRLSFGPDGNGGALHQFYKQGLWEKWHKQGVRYLNFVLIDNPLADPFDAELIGFHARKGSDIVVKATQRRDAAENVGVLAKEGAHTIVVEYSELDKDARAATNSDGSLSYAIANISLFSFDMDFIKTIAVNPKKTMPLHKAHKAVKFLDAQGKTVQALSPMAWKFEKFIFDLLPIAKNVDALVYPRTQCFAPLKNFSGNDSLESVPSAIEASDRHILASITSTSCNISPLEISQEFYYPTPDLLAKWQGRTITKPGYIAFIYTTRA